MLKGKFFIALLKNFGACFSSLKENNILLVVEFVADNNDVNITALITEAAKATPILSNTIVKGLCVTDSFSFNNNGSV